MIPSPRLATFSLLIAWLIPTEVVSENDWHLQRKFYLADRYKEYFIIHFLWKKWSPNVPQPTLRSESRGQVLLALCRAARRKTLLRRNLWGRHLSSVKRMLRTFEAIKRSPFLNPPPARRPTSPNFAVRIRLTRGNIFYYCCYSYLLHAVTSCYTPVTV